MAELTVWPLSKNSLLRREFLKELDRWSWPPGDQKPSGYIQHSTEFSVAGVVGSLKVPLIETSIEDVGLLRFRQFLFV